MWAVRHMISRKDKTEFKPKLLELFYSIRMFARKKEKIFKIRLIVFHLEINLVFFCSLFWPSFLSKLQNLNIHNFCLHYILSYFATSGLIPNSHLKFVSFWIAVLTFFWLSMSNFGESFRFRKWQNSYFDSRWTAHHMFLRKIKPNFHKLFDLSYCFKNL